MAVLSKFEVTVLVEGEKATEYDAEEDDQEENTDVKYIESTTGAKFSINFKIHPGFKKKSNHISFRTYIDGRFIHGEIIEKSDFPKGKLDEPFSIDLDGVCSKVNDQWSKHGFKFSEIAFAQANENREDTKRVSEAGTIRVEVLRLRLLGKIRRDSFVFPQLGDMSEKSAKGQAISHATSLDSGETTNQPPGARYRCKNLDKKPLAVFKFKYRSKNALQDLMVTPRSPSPPPPVEEKPVDDLTMHEMRELIRGQRAEAQAKIKREREEELASADPPRAHKRQHIKSEDDVECTFTRSLREAAAKPIDLTDE